jgi:hypothetical protein
VHKNRFGDGDRRPEFRGHRDDLSGLRAKCVLQSLLQDEERWEIVVMLVKELGKFMYAYLSGIGIKQEEV